MSNILESYKAAGVKSFTVQNNEAIADNPYVELLPFGGTNYEWRKFENLALPPLPTSGIPDGPVSIEDVEEQPQVYGFASQKWRTVSEHYEYADKQKRRIALVAKALRKGEEEKPEEYCKHCFERGGIKRRSCNSCQYDEMKAISAQPEKMEQTAEGSYAIRSALALMYSMILSGESHSEASESMFKKAMQAVDDAESQLAQYKEKVLKKLDSRVAELNGDDLIHSSNKAGRLKEIGIAQSIIKNS